MFVRTEAPTYSKDQRDARLHASTYLLLIITLSMVSNFDL
jgi:hypothetical protein